MSSATKKIYQSVPQNDNEDLDSIEVTYKPRYKEIDSRVDNWMNYIHSIIWVTVASLMWYYADVVNVLFYHKSDQIGSNVLWVAISCAGLSLSMIILVLIDSLRKGTGAATDFLEQYPVKIYIATFSGLFFWVCMIIALWPVYGWKSFPLVVITALASLMGLNLIPL